MIDDDALQRCPSEVGNRNRASLIKMLFVDLFDISQVLQASLQHS